MINPFLALIVSLLLTAPAFAEPSFVTLMVTGDSPGHVPLESIVDEVNAEETILKNFKVPRTSVISELGSGSDDFYDFAYLDPKDGNLYISKFSQYDFGSNFRNGLIPDSAFSIRNLLAAAGKADEMKANHRLFVLTGHGSPGAITAWGGEDITADAFKDMVGRPDPVTNVLISSVCFGGTFASTVSCGFFAARPDTYAEACSRDAKSNLNIGYVSRFFKAAGCEGNSCDADYDHDGSISFAEAHWFASTKSPTTDVEYTSVDDLAETQYQKWVQAKDADFSLPTVTGPDFAELVKTYATPGEKVASQELMEFAQHSNMSAFNLMPETDPNQFDDSARYAMRLTQMARRLLLRKFAAKHPRDPAAERLQALDSCENQSIRHFLGSSL